MAVSSVVFDVGETLVGESRIWTLMADRIGVPRLTVFGVIGGLIERRCNHREVFREFGVDPVETPPYEPGDLYPDALPCLEALRREGYRVGVAGNQPVRAERFLREAGFDVDFVATSAAWGVEKPSPGFFDKVVQACGSAPGEIAYVGDRVDNDVLPSARAGMVPVFLRRGPWGFLHASWPEAAQARIRVDSLVALPAALRDLRPAPH